MSIGIRGFNTKGLNDRQHCCSSVSMVWRIGLNSHSIVWSLLVATGMLALQIALALPSIAQGSNCNEPPPLSKANEALWFCDTGADTVIVFVHGLFSNSRNAWLHEAANSDNSVYWPQLVLRDKSLEERPASGRKPAVFLAGYYTRPDSGTYKIDDATKQLKQLLLSSVGGRRPVIDRSTIIFVAHSLGGVLVRGLLGQTSIANALGGKRLGLLLVASPSKGSGFADIGRVIQPAVRNKFIEELQTGSPYLEKVHKSFSKAIGKGGSLERLVGLEISEQLGMHESVDGCSRGLVSGLFCSASKSLSGIFRDVGVVVPRESAEVYWKDKGLQIPQSNHSTIARPTDLGHPSHRALQALYSNTRLADATRCRPPEDFRFLFRIRSTSPTNTQPAAQPGAGSSMLYRMYPIDPVTTEELRPPLQLNFNQLTKMYSIRIGDPPFACKGRKFWAKLVRGSSTSVKMDVRASTTDLCFRRRSRQQGDAKVATFDCAEGRSCAVDVNEQGLARECAPADRLQIPETTQDHGWSGDTLGYWNVPTIDNLRRRNDGKRPGYTEFHIISEKTDPVFDSTRFTVGVKVNGRPLYFGGRAPFSESFPLGPGSRVHHTFAVENLGFRGGSDGSGKEKIEVELRFFDGKKRLDTAQLSRDDYVAYRHAEMLRFPDVATGAVYNWHGFYRPAPTDNFEVMLEHGAKAEWMKFRRADFNSRKKLLFGLPVVGVIRPGRRDNSRIGLIVGLKLRSGQIKSLFSREDANKICRWLQRQDDLDRFQRERSYIFEFPRETFTDSTDRGRRVAVCSKV